VSVRGGAAARLHESIGAPAAAVQPSGRNGIRGEGLNVRPPASDKPGMAKRDPHPRALSRRPRARAADSRTPTLDDFLARRSDGPPAAADPFAGFLPGSRHFTCSLDYENAVIVAVGHAYMEHLDGVAAMTYKEKAELLAGAKCGPAWLLWDLRY